MTAKILEGKCVLVTGGTGSLGRVLIRRLLSGEMGLPKSITVFSRDEAKQHQMRLDYLHAPKATDEVIFENYRKVLNFRIGDVRDYNSVCGALRGTDVVFNAAALKQVPTCEYFPYEAVLTNVMGAENIVRAIQEHDLPVETVVGISTDKACKPINVMGMTKALQERVFIQANMRSPRTRFVCVRYGNVLASRGSVIPLFSEQIANGGPVTITSEQMTRFLVSLDDAVNCVFAVLREGLPGEIYVPSAASAYVTDVAKALIGEQDILIEIVGVRPGEKVHEAMVSDEEVSRTVSRGDWYAIRPLLPELNDNASDLAGDQALKKEFSSSDNIMSREETLDMLLANDLVPSVRGTGAKEENR